MIGRDKLHQLKSAARKPDFEPTTQLVHTLLDHGLEALDQMEGGKSTQELRTELVERERQVKLGLADLRAELERLGDAKALFTLAMVQQMFAAKGPAWLREWSYYTPRIDEEFG